MRLQLLRGELRQAEADEAARGQQVSQLRRRIEELQAHLRLCVAVEKQPSSTKPPSGGNSGVSASAANAR